MEIRKLALTDIADLQKIAKQTFYETFADGNSEQNMHNYLEEELSLDKLLSELKNADSEFYFALINNEPVGYLKLNHNNAQTELKDTKTLEIERIYVVQKFQGRKVGRLLFDKAKSIALRESVDFIWLGVWEKNEKAINFYQKNGFMPFDKHIFKLGEEEQTDIMMKLIL